MKRSVSPPARVASLGTAFALAVAGFACAPDQSVEPGAPELISYAVGQPGGGAFRIPASTPDCPTTPAGAVCTPSMNGMCRDVDAGHWCNCIQDMATPPDPAPDTGVWNCDPFGAVTAVFAIFDRLLDTAPLDPGDQPGLPDIATVTAAGAPVPVLTDYSPNGTPTALILLFFSQRWDGPSLFTVPDAGAFASATGLTVELDPAKVRAKDGTTPFSGTGALLDGRFSFRTAPFAGALGTPNPYVDPNMLFLAFTNLVDANTILDVVTPNLTVTVDGAPAGVTLIIFNEATVGIVPDMPWPAGSTVVATVAPAAPITSLLGEPLTAPVAPLTYMP
jgi:hypothetical protein